MSSSDAQSDELQLDVRAVHRLLVERWEQRGVSRERLDKEQVRQEANLLCRQAFPYLPADQHDIIAGQVVDRFLGLGVLEPLLRDESVTEIMVNSVDAVYVERKGRLERTTLRFENKEEILALINQIVSKIGRRIDESSPYVDARLPDGSRVNAIIPPLAINGPTLTIRRFPAQPFTIDRLIETEALTGKMASFLRACVRSKRNVLISGGTGSGKTSTLNALAGQIPVNERIITIEDAAEIRLDHPHVVSLESRPPNIEGQGEVPIRILVKNALRMRPDRIIVGEIRAGEALDMLQAMNTGHQGSLTTVHANAPEEALLRLETMVLMADLDLPLSAVRAQINSAIHFIIQQERLADGKRKIISICEVVKSREKGSCQLVPIYVYDKDRNMFLATGEIPTCFMQFAHYGVDPDLDWLTN